MLEVATITELHRVTVQRWHVQEIDNLYEGFLSLVCQQHEQNFRLWHEEDIARSPDAGDTQIAAVKRRIDALNQKRNDLIEKLDDSLVAGLAAWGVKPRRGARVNTETPGSAIDRLSIIALRIYHMEEQAARSDAKLTHRRKAEDRLAVLRVQHADLSESLGQLWRDIFAGRKRLAVYRQFKMYNDPTMNPYLYAAERHAA